jgi:phosphoribosylanthranilate isomerase
MKSTIKICGLSDPQSIETAINNGAKFLGFVLFYPKSPRNIDPRKLKELTQQIPNSINKVTVLVNPTDEQINSIKNFCNYVQLHGEETNERVKEIKNKFKIKVIKVIKIKNKENLNLIKNYQDADEILLDTPAMEKSEEFNFDLIKDLNISSYFLAGGINIKNIEKALKKTSKIDVSSGLESLPGIKDQNKIIDFLNKVKSYEA